MSKVSNELAEKLKRQKAKTEENCFENLPEQTSADVQAGMRKRGSIEGAKTGQVGKQRERMESSISAEGNPEKSRSDIKSNGATANLDSENPLGLKAKSKAKANAKVPAETPSTSMAVPETSEVQPLATAETQSDVAADLIQEAVGGAGNDDNDDADESSGDDTEDDMPNLEGGTSGAGDGEHRQNRAEKKSRKAVAKLGLKPVPDIVRVAIKKAPNILFMIAKPDVFRAPNSNVYVVFGEAKVEDLSATAQQSAAEKFTSSAHLGGTAPEITEIVPEEEDETGEVDETGVEPKDVELVMGQADVSRARAVKALKANNNDIVEAIMALSSS